ncbi:hypothetical protein C0989_004468 [Termitomyces sp. Mn162]|nr:hypothetical protein C0989_004468 [Termitomyces sp. Mn162]
MASPLPVFSIPNPTPPRSADSALNSYRLLYRGSLSLPDSHLLLDGLTFVARLDSPSKNNHLLQNPLALALESMRGRPSLRFMGIVKLHDDQNLWLDESGGIEMDIHPRATMTRIYFENVFCLTPFSSTSTSAQPDTSDIGIKVALGDSGAFTALSTPLSGLISPLDGPETTHVVIYARSNQADNSLNLTVARLMARPQPSQSSLRLPRPDDPTPRKPPLLYAASSTRSGLKRVPSLVPGRELKRVASQTSIAGSKHKKAADVDGGVMADLGSGVRLGEGTGSGLFKVPEVPLHGKSVSKGKGKQVEGDKDVFGTSSSLKAVSKGKRKRDTDQDQGVGEVERTNKDTIKRNTLEHLYKRKDPTTSALFGKSHPEFKELFSYISRGVVFALRGHLKLRPVDLAEVEHLVRLHADMYIRHDSRQPELDTVV